MRGLEHGSRDKPFPAEQIASRMRRSISNEGSVNASIAIPLYWNRGTRTACGFTIAVLVAFLLAMPCAMRAQEAAGPSAALTGRVTDASTHNSIVGAAVTIEGTTIGAR